MVHFKNFFAASICLLISCYAYTKDHYNKVIDQMQIDTSSGCLMFTLKGVSEADPVKTNGPWFAMHPENPSKDYVMSMLLISYSVGSHVKVTTTGNTQCGHAEFRTIRLQKKD